MSELTVAVLGTGIMGAPMARNIAKAGHDVTVWNRTREKAERVEGARVADSPADAVEQADLVVTMLADGDAVENVMSGGGALEAMRDDAVWLQMSTVGIAATERLSKLAEDRGVAFVDSPVLGTKKPAEEAQLIVLASGPEDPIERARPVFDAVGSKTIELGPAGTGTRLKLVLNNWLLAITEATAETIGLAEALGVDPAKFLEVIAGGPLDSAYAQMKAKMILAEDFPTSFPLALALKDAWLVLEAAERHGFDAALTAAIARKMEQATEMGHGGEDMAATFFASKVPAAR
jgi:3-hydroxyisobutyrate dehydrogenase